MTADVDDWTTILPYGLMDAFAVHPQADVVYETDRCWLLQVDCDHLMVVGPHGDNLIDDPCLDLCTWWLQRSHRDWSATFESVGNTQLVHLWAVCNGRYGC